MATGVLELDGSKGEGGGQILRSALTLSMLTGRPFRLRKIRANRDKPGLRPQHLAAVEAAAKVCSAEVRGGSVGSREITFHPGPVRADDFAFEIGTAGSTALVLQTIALPLALRGDRAVRVAIGGGTFNIKAPSFPFLDECWRPLCASMGLPMVLSMPSPGFFPKGGGRLEAWIEPAQPSPVSWVDRGNRIRIRGVAGACRLGRDIPDRMRARAIEMLLERDLDSEIVREEWDGPSPGAALTLTVEHEGGCAATFVGLGERGKPAEVVAAEAVAELLEYEESGGAIDPHSADQILLPLAFAEGRSEYTVSSVTEHLRTNARTLGAFLDREIRVIEPEGAMPGRVIVA